MPKYSIQTLPGGALSVNGWTIRAPAPGDLERLVAASEGVSTARARAMLIKAGIEAGRHPMGRHVRDGAERCATCRHACQVETPARRTYYKCGLMKAAWTKGPATDIRLAWPACSAWEGDDRPGRSDQRKGVALAAGQVWVPERRDIAMRAIEHGGPYHVRYVATLRGKSDAWTCTVREFRSWARQYNATLGLTAPAGS